MVFKFFFSKEKTIILLQFSHWPHNGVPADASVVLGIIRPVETLDPTYKLLSAFSVCKRAYVLGMYIQLYIPSFEQFDVLHG